MNSSQPDRGSVLPDRIDGSVTFGSDEELTLAVHVPVSDRVVGVLDLLPTVKVAAVVVQPLDGTVADSDRALAGRMLTEPAIAEVLHGYIISEAAAEAAGAARQWTVECALRTRSAIDLLQVPEEPGGDEGLWPSYRGASFAAAIALHDLLPAEVRHHLEPKGVRPPLIQLGALLARDATPMTANVLRYLTLSAEDAGADDDALEKEIQALEDQELAIASRLVWRDARDAHFDEAYLGPEADDDQQDGDVDIDLSPLAAVGLIDISTKAYARRVVERGFAAWELTVRLRKQVTDPLKALQAAWESALARTPDERAEGHVRRALTLRYGKLCAATHLPLPLDLFLDSLSEVNPRPLSLVDVVCTFTDGSNYAAVTMPEGKDRLALVAPLPLARRPSAATVYFDLASHRAPAPRPAAELIELRRSWAQVGHKLPSKEEQRLLNNLLQFLRDARDDVAARALEAESRSVPELRGPRPNRFLQRLCDEVRALQSSLEDRLDAAVSKENVNENEVARLCAALWKVRLYLMGPPA